jgi:hypothetical protein
VAFVVENQTTLLEKDGRPYCENCYDAKFGEQCAAGCGRGLGPQRVKALGSLWHPDCFRYSPIALAGNPITHAQSLTCFVVWGARTKRCTACKAKFEGSGVINRGGKPYCKTCSAK